MNRSIESHSLVIKPVFSIANNNSIAVADRPNSQPKISCVIPAYNEGENLKVLLPQLAECISRYDATI